MQNSTDDMVFVFGSNERGIHGAGAAKFAHIYKGAIWGRGFGRFGRSYAIPTKDIQLKSLSLEHIKGFVEVFLEHARANPQTKFQITCIGCGLAGYRHDQVAPMFEKAPDNCYFDLKWQPYLSGERHFWGAL